MATISTTWDTAVPADTNLVSEGALEIRNLKTALGERLRNAGIKFPDSDDPFDPQSGRQMCGQHDTNRWKVFETDETTEALDLDDNASTFTVGDGVGGANAYQLAVDSLSMNAAIARIATATRGTFTVNALSTDTSSTITHGSLSGRTDSNVLLIWTASASPDAARSAAVGGNWFFEVDRNATGSWTALPSLVTFGQDFNTSGRFHHIVLADMDTSGSSNAAGAIYRVNNQNLDTPANVAYQKSLFILIEFISKS